MSIASGSVTGNSAAGNAVASSAPTAAARASPAATSSNAAPIAPMEVWNSGTKRLPSWKSNASRSACTAPLLAATPPMNATGGSTILPLEIVPRKLRMTASQRPRRTSGGS